MIIRIMGEGQYDVPDDAADALNASTSRSRRRSSPATTPRSPRRSRQLLERVRAPRQPRSPTTSLVDSDLVLPPSDSTVDEVARLLGDEGLIPG